MATTESIRTGAHAGKTEHDYDLWKLRGTTAVVVLHVVDTIQRVYFAGMNAAM